MSTTPDSSLSPPNSSQRTRQLPLLLQHQQLQALLIAALGLAVLLGTLGYSAYGRDLWSDEAYSASYTFHPGLGELLNDVRKNEETPPLYFITLWAWARVFGHGEAALRALSAVWAGLTIVAFAGFASAKVRPAEAGLATVMLALAPLMYRYAFEARGYTMTIFVSVLCFAAFEQLYQSPERRSAQLLYALSAAALMMTSYFGAAVLGGQGLLWLWLLREPRTRWRRLRAGLLMVALVALCVAPWLPYLTYQVHIAPAVTEKQTVSALLLMALLLTAAVGSPMVAPLVTFWAAGMICWALAIFAPVALRGRPEGGLIVRTLLIPTVTLMLFVGVLEVSQTRYVITLIPWLYLAVAISGRALYERRRPVGFTMLAIVGASLLALRVLSPTTPATSSWEQISERLAGAVNPATDGVIVHPPWDQRIFEYYYRGPAVPVLGAHHYDDFFHTKGYPFPQSWRPEDALAAVQGHRRAWLLQDSRLHNQLSLEPAYREAGRWSDGQMTLILYERRAP